MLAVDTLMEIRLETTDLAGTLISAVDVGDDFLLRAFVEDLRGGAQSGVASAYMDVTFDAGLASVVDNSIVHGDDFGVFVSGDTSSAGLVDEVGSFFSDFLGDPLGPGEFFLYSFQVSADSVGELTFSSDFADLGLSQALLSGLSQALTEEEILFGNTTIDVLQFGATDDGFNVDENSTANSLDVLGNDSLSAAGGAFEIVSIGDLSAGGSAEIVGNAIHYTPAANTFGEETFTYLMRDGLGNDDQAVVTVTTDPGPPSSISNFVWQDISADGIQDVGEPGVDDVTVELFHAGLDAAIGGGDDSLISTTTTAFGGLYAFNNLNSGNYYLKFSDLPVGFQFTLADQGTNDLVDSDVDPGTGRTDVFLLVADSDDASRDAGLLSSIPAIIGQFDLTVGRMPSATDAEGETVALPEGDADLLEWDSIWVEVWGSTPQSVAIGVESFSVTLNYNTDFYTAVSVVAGTAFDGNLTSTIDDGAGQVQLAGIKSIVPTVGDDEFVLLARVELKPMAGDDGVPIDLLTEQPIAPVSGTWVSLADDSSAQMDLDSAISASVQVEAPSLPRLWPVLYDLNDDNTIDFGDLAIMSAAFLKTVGAVPESYKSDFNLDDRVDFGDFSLLVSNFLKSRGSTNPLALPANFPEDWLASLSPDTTAPLSVSVVDNESASLTQPAYDSAALGELTWFVVAGDDAVEKSQQIHTEPETTEADTGEGVAAALIELGYQPEVSSEDLDLDYSEDSLGEVLLPTPDSDRLDLDLVDEAFAKLDNF